MAAHGQEVCKALGAPESISAYGTKEIAKELKAYFAPDALDAVHQEVVKFLRFRKTAI